MKFSALLATSAALFTTASASDILLNTYLAGSDDAKGIATFHEGAAFEYLFVGDGGSETVIYDSITGKVVKEVASGDKFNYNLTLGLQEGTDGFPFLSFSAQDNSVWWFVDHVSKLGAVGSDGKRVQFYASKNASDPYNHSADSFALGATSAENFADFTNIAGLEGLQPVDISVNFVSVA